MRLSFEIDNQKFTIDSNKFFDISIHQNFSENQVSSFSVRKAKASPYTIGDFIGDTNKGSSCNFDELTITPHCNGTHTECIGHILNTRDKITDNIDDVLVPAYLVSCSAQSADKTSDSYLPRLESNDKVISLKELNSKIANLDLNEKALIIRTIPNSENKKYQDYDTEKNIFFTNEAMKLIANKGVKHLLVDQSSVDKSNDEGILSNHRIYWNVELNKKDKIFDKHFQKTISEFIFVPDNIKDGMYLLNIQIAPFGLDASPSRPIIFEVFSE